MRYEHTVEHKAGLNRRQHRKLVKHKLKLKKKYGIGKHEPALDTDIGMATEEQVKYDTDMMNAYLKAHNVI